MTFLNEVADHYPGAVSAAACSQYEEFYEVEDLHRYLRRFTRHLTDDLRYDEGAVRRTLFQYGRTKGIIHHLIARNLLVDEGMEVDPESIVVTVGCQEAMFLGPAGTARLRPRRAARRVTDVRRTHRSGAAGRPPGAPGRDGIDRHRPRRPGGADPPRPVRGAAAAGLLRDAGLREPVRAEPGPGDPQAAAGDRRGRGRPAAGGQPVRAVPRCQPAHGDAEGARHAAAGGHLGSFAKTPCRGCGSATWWPTRRSSAGCSPTSWPRSRAC